MDTYVILNSTFWCEITSVLKHIPNCCACSCLPGLAGILLAILLSSGLACYHFLILTNKINTSTCTQMTLWSIILHSFSNWHISHLLCSLLCAIHKWNMHKPYSTMHTIANIAAKQTIQRLDPVLKLGLVKQLLLVSFYCDGNLKISE